MANNYFIEYARFINDIQNKLLRIQLRFNECLETIKSAVKEGVLSSGEGDKLLAQRMDTYYGDVPKRYRLSITDVEFIQKYADIDRNGQVLASFLKRDYLDKKDKLSAILESVKVYGYLDSLSKEDARLHVKVAMHDYYSAQLGSIEFKMSNYLQMYGENGKHTKRYAEMLEYKNKIQKALNAVAGLDNVSDEMFDKVVSQFYDVQRKYYDWFLKMEIKSEYEKGTIYQEHCDTMSAIDSTSDVVLSASDDLVKLNKELESNNSALFNALINISTFDISRIITLHEKPKKRLFKKEEDNNRDVLLDIFISLMSINGINVYATERFGNGESSVNLNSSFDSYFNNRYGIDTMYLDPNVFVNDLRSDIVLYFKEKIENILNKINQQTVKINSNTTLMCGNIKVGMNQAGLQRDIREQYPAKKDELIITGFTFEELERIYTDLKEFVGNGFSFGTDDEELFLRKV